MPLYEYKCKKCGHRFERIQSYSAQDVKECPVCHGEVERLISAPAAHFKGSGFYSTDYAAKPAATGNSGGSDGAAAGSGEKPAAPKKESTPAPSAPAAKSE